MTSRSSSPLLAQPERGPRRSYRLAWSAGRRLVLALVIVLGAQLVMPSVRAGAPVGIRGEHFVDATGQPVFLLGVNYEGPADRAWEMWDDGKFDATLIGPDLDRARAAGLSVVRVFIQQSLAEDIRAGRWIKLDTFLRLADLRGLKVILTFADYPDSNLERLVAIDTAVASRYRGRSTILAYDLKNEPRFFDLALSQYPTGTYVALQDRVLVPLVGETIPRDEIPAYRETEQGQARIPSWLSDDRAHIYTNMHHAYLQLMEDAQAWAREREPTSVAYLTAPESAHWGPFKEALNDTLATWIRLRVNAVRAADPEALITIGHVDPYLASLPANNLLDYRTLHRYPTASSAGIRAAAALFQDVRAALPGKPLVLGEFGFANASVAEDRSAQLEAEVVRAIVQANGAGALKWMLNDFPLGHNERENTLGMFRGDGTPKPVVAAFRELAGLVPSTRPAPLRPPDYPIADGHFFTQGSGRPPERDGSGFAVTNGDGIPFWDTMQQLGLENVGYPISSRFLWDGTPTQVFQKVVLQGRPGEAVVPANLFDALHDRGLDTWLQNNERVPPPIDPAADSATTWEELVRAREALLDASPAIRDHYQAAPDPLLLFGLPTSPPRLLGDAVAVRTQRGVLLHWQRDMPWAPAGTVTTANGGEIAARLGLFPAGALVPEPTPPLQVMAPSPAPTPGVPRRPSSPPGEPMPASPVVPEATATVRP